MRPARKSRDPLSEAELFDYATASLARRAQSVAELKRKLRVRVEPDEAGERKITAVVEKLKEYRFLHDANFAANYTRLRQENDKFGRRRVQQGLLQKGIHPEVANQALDQAYGDMSEEALARAYIDRKRIPAPRDKRDAARAMRRLAAAGFTAKTIYALLRSWRPEGESGEMAIEEPEGGQE